MKDKKTGRREEGLLSYASIPFWSWNYRLKPEKLREQIGWMKRQGLGGFIIHARKGLLTEYMGEEWLSCVDVCIEEAERLGMEVWLYDENGWPSGFAGGALLRCKENHVWYLDCEEKDSFDADALAVFVRQADGFQRIHCEIEGYAVYYTVYARQNASYVDILNPAVVKQFIEQTHEVYYRRFSRHFGHTLQGFFTDEPQYFRWEQPWSPIVPQMFSEAYGYDVLDGLIALFHEVEGAAAFRNDFWKLMNHLLMENYQKTVYDWCEAHNCRITGHTIEENSLCGQMMCSAGVMTFYEYEHVPGIDCLTLERDPELAARQCASVARQTGRRQVLTESFAACGWSATPLDLKRVAERQFVAGINRLNLHLLPYSVVGARKRDYPPFFSIHNPWMLAGKDFNQYFEKLGRLLGQAEDIAPALVIHPLRSAYTLYRFNDGEALRRYDNAFLQQVEQWKRDGLLYHFGDETLLAKYGSADGGKLVVGCRRYDCVILPALLSIDGSTAVLLRRFVDQGGRLCVLGGPPHLLDGRLSELASFCSTISYEDILRRQPFRLLQEGDGSMQAACMEDSQGRFLYVLNGSEEQKGAFHVEQEDLWECNLLADEGGEEVVCQYTCGDRIALRPGESKFFRFGMKKTAVGEKETTTARLMPLGDSWVIDPTTQNILVLDRAMVVKENGETLPKQTVMQVFNHLLRTRYQGKIALQFLFVIRYMPSELKLIAETGLPCNLTVNGQELSAGHPCEKDNDFTEYDIADLCCTGINRIVMNLQFYQKPAVYDILYGQGITESLKNCMAYDTELENLYLVGTFGVYSQQAFEEPQPNRLVAPSNFFLASLPKRVSGACLVEEGFPFFSGALRLRCQVEVGAWKTGNRAFLYAQFYGALVRVYIKGAFAGQLLFGDSCAIGSWLHMGQNTIVLELITTGRNLYGPHHHPALELRCVSAEEYGEQAAEEGKLILAGQYAFIRTGLDKVWISLETGEANLGKCRAE